MSGLEARDLSVRYGGATVLDRVSLRLPSGAFVAVIGANGAGKSTLLRMLAGRARPDAGEVTLDGRPLSGLAAAALARRRAYLPQTPRAEWPIAVERLVALGLLPHLPAFGPLPQAFRLRLDQALAAFNLLDRRGQPATTLSGGELARAMLARALIGEPDVLIADEPVAGLDPRHALDSTLRFRDQARAGRLVIASMHDLTLVARYASHVAALDRGRLAAFGPTPETLTAALISRVFEVQGRIVGHGQDAYVDFLPITTSGSPP